MNIEVDVDVDIGVDFDIDLKTGVDNYKSLNMHIDVEIDSYVDVDCGELMTMLAWKLIFVLMLILLHRYASDVDTDIDNRSVANWLEYYEEASRE